MIKKWLFDGTVPSNKKLYEGTVLSNKKLYDGTLKNVRLRMDVRGKVEGGGRREQVQKISSVKP